MRSTALATLALATVLGHASATARAASTSNWYWTSGECKYQLQTYGVSIGDGRSYNVQKAFCVGLHDHCWLSGGVRRYKVFYTVMRSYDGVVRTMLLTVTGQKTWRGSKLKIVAQYMSLDSFIESYGPAAWTVATTENEAGCYDIHP